MIYYDLRFVNTLISHSRASSVRDIKVFTKKRKEDEGVGEEENPPLIRS